jgi:uncharacterized protein (DUF4415 family)
MCRPMKKETDYSKGRRGPLRIPKGKTRVTIYLDDAVIESFRAKSEKAGKGYQTLINETLRLALEKKPTVLTAEKVREIMREELAQHA